MEDEGLRSACVAVGWNWWWLQDVAAATEEEAEAAAAARVRVDAANVHHIVSSVHMGAQSYGEEGFTTSGQLALGVWERARTSRVLSLTRTVSVCRPYAGE